MERIGIGSEGVLKSMRDYRLCASGARYGPEQANAGEN